MHLFSQWSYQYHHLYARRIHWWLIIRLCLYVFLSVSSLTQFALFSLLFRWKKSLNSFRILLLIFFFLFEKIPFFGLCFFSILFSSQNNILFIIFINCVCICLLLNRVWGFGFVEHSPNYRVNVAWIYNKSFLQFVLCL